MADNNDQNRRIVRATSDPCIVVAPRETVGRVIAYIILMLRTTCMLYNIRTDDVSQPLE